MKAIIFLPLLLMITMAQGYLFTNKDGRTVEAEVSKANDKDVWLRLSSGRSIKISRAKLIDDDQKYITEWMSDQLPNIQVEPNLVRTVNSKRGYFEKNYKQTLSFSANIENFSADKELEECEVIYYFIGRSIKNKKNYKVLSRQVRNVSVPPNGEESVKFTDIVNHYENNRSYGFGQRGHKGLDYVLHIKRKRDGRTVHLSSPSILLGKNKENIIMLSNGDVTGDDFLKRAKPAAKGGGKGEGPPEVITIR